jgi:hypothetical protein
VSRAAHVKEHGFSGAKSPENETGLPPHGGNFSKTSAFDHKVLDTHPIIPAATKLQPFRIINIPAQNISLLTPSTPP